MATEIARRITDSLGNLAATEAGRARRASAEIEKAVSEAVAFYHGRGIVAAGRARGIEYATRQIMNSVGNISVAEAMEVDRAPHAEGRYRRIADVATMALGGIIEDLRQP
jgi:hypothetical protein